MDEDKTSSAIELNQRDLGGKGNDSDESYSGSPSNKLKLMKQPKSKDA